MVTSMPMRRPAKVLHLSLVLRILTPSLLLRSASKNAIGFAFLRTIETLLAGFMSLLSSILLGYLFYSTIGLASFPLFVWLVGSAGIVMIAHCVGPGYIFVKSLCAGCKLRPIIIEHEAVHISGISSEAEVWRRLKGIFNNSFQNLASDYEVCTFCPIVDHLGKHGRDSSRSC